jgi:carboxyl-terminal processing protease
LSNGGALRLTTAHYYTPAGTNIEEKGIEPDIVFKPKVQVAQSELSPEEIVKRRDHPELDETVEFALSLIKGASQERAKE